MNGSLTGSPKEKTLDFFNEIKGLNTGGASLIRTGDLRIMIPSL